MSNTAKFNSAAEQRGEALTGWQAIESAPKEVISLFFCDDHNVAVGYWREGWGWTTMKGQYPIKATHWMPLPSPPERGEARARSAGFTPPASDEPGA